jgi:hypothetical protein
MPHPIASPSLIKTGLVRAPRRSPAPPALSRRGRWSPPMPTV